MSFQSKPRRPSYGGTKRSYGGPSNNNRRRSGGSKKENIHPSRFIKEASEVKVDPYVPQYKFSDFPISDLILKNLEAKGITKPSAIQDQSIEPGLAGSDVIGIANTGTGKTVAFAVPVLQKLITRRQSKALIIAPTRELAQQIEEEIQSIAKGSGLQGALLIGGAPMGPQLRNLRSRPSIIIGTPGRIKDHIERGSLSLSHFDTVVLDEVDRMLDMGFINDMRFILDTVATPRQSFFFSATLDKRVDSLIQTFLTDPITISVRTSETSDNVEQNVVKYRSNNEKLDKLHELLIGDIDKALIFDDTQRSVERLSKELLTRGFSADAIHGGKSQNQRSRALKRFKSNDITVLVATDVAARGLDVSDITHVINYSTPQSYEDYVHRIGRAGRAGRTGVALTFIEG
jgi:ATP-dependent RNA helicase RhlE